MVRRLTARDVPAALELSRAAAWNQTADDWVRLLALDPEGCLGCECDDHLVATATLLAYGGDLAWLGMVLTHPDYRRRGFARQVVEAALALADRHGIRTVKLDATDQGRPLYLQFGFEDEQSIERWRREPGPQPAAPITLPTGPPDLDLDRVAFGADRTRFVETLGPALLFDGGFAMHRAGRVARYLGPCIGHDPKPVEAALQTLIAAYPTDPWFWDLLPDQAHAVAIARSLGFARVRRLTRMRRGAPTLSQDHLIYAIAGFEAG
jgi:GNAT superfamily N-acetyltransferase